MASTASSRTGSATTWNHTKSSPPQSPGDTGSVLQAINHGMEKIAVKTTSWAGSTWAFMFAALLTITWLVCGPIFHFTDTWQLVMNTLSSIVTFLMVFLLQRSQNKEALAMQIKLNELLASVKGASNRLINVEDLTEEEVRALHARYQQLADKCKNLDDVGQRMSIEQTAENGTRLER